MKLSIVAKASQLWLGGFYVEKCVSLAISIKGKMNTVYKMQRIKAFNI